MALDGAFLSIIKKEIADTAIGARVDKVSQPAKEEIILHLRWRGGGGKLLLSANAGSARIHFTATSPENPKSPPMFCMLLRKHLMSAKLTAVRQIGMDRILFLDFETRNEIGDLAAMSLGIEIMGRHSNIMLLGPENRIVDSIKRVDLETSSVRQVLPGMRYALPPAQNKLNPADTDPGQIIERILAGRDIELSKAVIEAVQGMSPVLAREIAYLSCGVIERRVSELQDDHIRGLKDGFENLINRLQSGDVRPVMLCEANGRPREFSFMPVAQYGDALSVKEYPDCCSLLDAFYSERDSSERMRQRGSDMLKLLVTATDRIARKLDAQRCELVACAQRDQLKMKGDLLNANLYSIHKGDSVARVQDFYTEGNPEVLIELDIMLTPAQNAQRYYALYRKADTAEKKLQELIKQGEEELVYLDSVFDTLSRARLESELDSIRRELSEGGYVKRKGKNHKQKEEKLQPLRYRSADGFLILSGRNNIQNDRLTLKDSNNRDIWLHTQKIPGSHTVIVTEGKDVPKSTIEQACIIAAYNSKARESSKVPVDFTLVRYVKKPNGAKPGMVIYDNFETVIVDPDPETIEKLQLK